MKTSRTHPEGIDGLGLYASDAELLESIVEFFPQS
jgi:hypothetical protein